MQNKNIFKRFTEIFKPDFLAKNIDKINSNETWKFWFLSNSLFAIVVIAFLSLGIVKAINEGESYLKSKYPNAKISVQSGKLNTQGFEEPIYIETKEDNSVFVVDTKGLKYDQTVLSNFSKGVFISADKVYNKKSIVEMQQFDISQIKKDFTVTIDDLLAKKTTAEIFFITFFAVIIWIYLNAIRLISALWWSLWFWLLAIIMKIEDVTYSRVYFSVLNFYIIPLTISFFLMFLKINIPFLTTGIFLILFVVNYHWLKKNLPSQNTEEKESEINQK